MRHFGRYVFYETKLTGYCRITARPAGHQPISLAQQGAGPPGCAAPAAAPATTGRITGTVTDAATGKPVSYATVAVLDAAGKP